MSKESAFSNLPDDDKFFVLTYIRLNGNGPETVRELGLNEGHVNPLSIYHVVRRKMGDPRIRAAIDELMQNDVMTALEVLQRHTEIARADIADVLDDETGTLDLKKAKSRGKTRLIRAITTRSWVDKTKGVVTETRCELHNAQQAQATLAKHHGLLADVIKIKDLPKDRDKLLELLAYHVERTTGRKVSTAVSGNGKGN